MTFSYDKQEHNTYLVYKLDHDEVIDQVAYNMITNNEIEGILPVAYSQMNSERQFKFNISSKINLKQYFIDTIKRNRFITVLQSMTETAISIDEYMMEPKYFIYNLDYIFVDVSSSMASLVYLPTIREEKVLDLKSFVKDLMFNLQYDVNDNLDYVAKIINAFNKGHEFTLLDMQRVLNELKTDRMDNINKNVNSTPVEPQNIDIAKLTVQKSVESVSVAPIDKKPERVPEPQEPKKIEKSKPIKSEKKKLFVKKEKKQNKVDKVERFEIPGQEVDLVTPKEIVSNQAVKAISKPVSSEPKLSKKQIADEPKPSKKQIANEPLPDNRQRANESSSISNSNKNDNFGKTFIIGGSASNKTVIIGSQAHTQDETNPYILRTKTMEKIYIDKEVFRIGKEAEFVDYCLRDNKTISRVHANVINKNNEYYIMDLNSLNHTYVNDQIISSNVEVLLTDGDKIRLSNEIFEFKLL